MKKWSLILGIFFIIGISFNYCLAQGPGDDDFMGQEEETNQPQKQQEPPKFLKELFKPFIPKSSKNVEEKESPKSNHKETSSQKTYFQKGKAKPKPKVEYSGYSKKFVPIKKMLVSGKTEKIAKIYEEKDKKIKDSCGKGKKNCYMEQLGLLGCLERGTLYLDIGNFDKSVEFFSGSEHILRSYGNESKAHTFFTKLASFTAEFISGHEEIKPYYGTGFERVLMLNYKSVDYMLEGDRRAYNVTRRAIDWQNMERKIFEEKKKEIAKKLREKKEEAKSKNVKVSEYGVGKQVSDAYKKTDAKASTVASAYVNPFGYYLAGVIQELESIEDRSLIYNARISYEKALELNPKSRVIRSAVRDLKRRKCLPRNRKLVHVIINEGFAPEKKVMTYYFSLGEVTIPLKLPVYVPVKSRVYRIDVRTLRGKRIVSLSPIADVEAIALRHQKDLKPFVTFRIMTNLVRYLGEEYLIGDTLTKLKESIATPDTRSWMMLPKTILGARFYVPKGVRKVMIVAYNRKWRRIAKEIVTLSKTGPTFIYGRSINRFLVVYAHKGLWIKN